MAYLLPVPTLLALLADRGHIVAHILNGAQREWCGACRRLWSAAVASTWFGDTRGRHSNPKITRPRQNGSLKGTSGRLADLKAWRGREHSPALQELKDIHPAPHRRGVLFGLGQQKPRLGRGAFSLADVTLERRPTPSCRVRSHAAAGAATGKMGCPHAAAEATEAGAPEATEAATAAPPPHGGAPTHGYKATREAAMTALAKSWRRE